MKKEKKRTYRELIMSSGFRIIMLLALVSICVNLFKMPLNVGQFSVLVGILFIDKVYYFCKELS